MEKVTISREALQYLTREVISWHEFDGLDLSFQDDRITARYIDEAITALDLQNALDKEREEKQAEASRLWKEKQAKKQAESVPQNGDS